jgi:hypothetical protein
MPLTFFQVFPPSTLRSMVTCGHHNTSGFFGIDGDGRVVPGTLPQGMVAAGQGPALAAVVGAEQPPFSASISA